MPVLFAVDSQGGREDRGWQTLREGGPQKRRRAWPHPQERDSWSEVDGKVREGLHRVSRAVSQAVFNLAH